MKFAVISERKENVDPASEDFRSLHQEQREYLSRLVNEGILEAAFNLDQNKGTIRIFEVTCESELKEIVRNQPYSKFMNSIFYPLRGDQSAEYYF